MKKIFTLLLIIYTQIVFAQTISLEDEVYYRKNQLPYPIGTTYVKDINHRLDSLVGIWKGYSGGRSYEIVFTKRENWDFGLNTPGGVNWDVLIGRLLVKDSVSNLVIFNTLNISDDTKTFFKGYYYVNRSYNMDFYGPENGCYDYGDVFIGLRLNDPTVMLLTYYRGGDLIDSRTCPGGYANYRPVLPAKLFLQKQ